MPDRTYQPHNPPTWWDRMLHHPFEVALAAWWVLCGVGLAVSFALTGTPASPSLSRLPITVVAVATVGIGVGGALVLAALLHHWRMVTTGWWLERFGLALAAAGWLIYATAVAIPYPHSIVSWSLGLAMGTSAGLRLVASLFVEVATRRAIKRTGA